jgi:hypothetical protein
LTNLIKIWRSLPLKILFFSTNSVDSVLEFNSKLSKIALDTFKKNAELSQEWSKETLNALENLTKTQKKP